MVTKEVTRCDFCGRDIDGAPYAKVKVIKPAANWDICTACAKSRGLFVDAAYTDRNPTTQVQGQPDYFAQVMR